VSRSWLEQNPERQFDALDGAPPSSSNSTGLSSRRSRRTILPSGGEGVLFGPISTARRLWTSRLRWGVTRGSVNRWLQWYDLDHVEGLRTRIAEGPAPKLSAEQREALTVIIELGPIQAADAIRSELATGRPVARHFHSIRGRETIRALNKWLARNPDASANNIAGARAVLQDLISALARN